ncbi:energy transducer TonB [Shimia sp. R9_3]|uniref:cell envelope integrity protein TolA n=1 Tax=Shimia sp. R9_3 TaxID=2821113 RepID=UPI001ADB381C|nr:energy transducer TonB [Shimia sp. R9_3]MBO9402660.1 TonB family protein [Shimia sp. R9_3]
MRLARITSEALVFGGIVTAGHLAFFAPQLESGLQSAGDAGADLLQMMASNASIAALVETWDAPPDLPEAMDLSMPQQSVPQDAPPPMPVAAAEVSPQMSDMQALNLPSADGPPLPVAPAAQAPNLQSDMATPPAQLPPEQPAPPQAAVPPRAAPPELPRPMEAPVLEAAPKAPASPPPPPKPPAPEKKKTEKKAAQSATDSIQIDARRAQGEGGKTAKGKNGDEKTASVSNAKRKSLARKWANAARARIAQRTPSGVGEGTATVRITVSVDGKVSGIFLLKSSGNTRLDQAALKSVRAAGRMPKAPAGLGVPSLKMDIPISSK